MVSTIRPKSSSMWPRYARDRHTARAPIAAGALGTSTDDHPHIAGICSAREEPEEVLEATYGWYWTVDALRDQGAVLHLAQPSQ